jgi:hypothetical protein
VSEAFATGDWTPPAGGTLSVVSGRLRWVQTTTSASRFVPYTALADRADIYQQVLWDTQNANARVGAVARGNAGAVPTDWFFTRVPNAANLVGNQAMQLAEQVGGVTLQIETSGDNRSGPPRNIWLWLDGPLIAKAYTPEGDNEEVLPDPLTLLADGRHGILFSNDSALTNTLEIGAYLAMRTARVRVEGPEEDGWKVVLRDAGAAVLAEEAAVDGLVEIDTFAARIPATTIASVEIRDVATDAVIVAAVTPDETVWPGDVWIYGPEEFAPCTIALDVFEADAETVAWRVTTDPAKPNPYLDRPGNYGARELDPVRGAAVISTVTVSVRDVAQTPGDQDSGFVTERLEGIYGRRCRLLRYPAPGLPAVLISDGPAGPPRLGADYASYSFEIRDTRESERKLRPFRDSATLSLFPFGPVDPWGPLAGATPIVARADHQSAFGFVTVSLVPAAGGFFAETLDEEQVAAVAEPLVAGRPIGSFREGPVLHDVLWRLEGSGDPWSQVYPDIISVVPVSIATFDDEGRTAAVTLAVTLVGLEADLPAHNASVEFLIRYRGEPTEQLPAYFEGTLGALLTTLYDRELERPAALGGAVRDLFSLAPVAIEELPVRYEPAALAALTDPVLIRQVERIRDGREWAEAALYSASGWIPAIDAEGRISPVSRELPAVIGGPEITGAIARPSPDWNAGERLITEVRVRSHRYFLPSDDVVARGTDGIATRTIERRAIGLVNYERHDEHVETFDATAFAFVGDAAGEAVVVGGETVDDLFTAIEASVLARYGAGAPAIELLVIRDAVSTLREGDFVPVSLTWMPGDGPARGLEWPAAQVLMIGEEDCAWRRVLLERSEPSQS